MLCLTENIFLFDYSIWSLIVVWTYHLGTAVIVHNARIYKLSVEIYSTIKNNERYLLG